MLISMKYVYFIVSRKSVHERENIVFGTIINDLIDIRGRIVVLRKFFVNIPIFDAYYNSTLLLVNWNNIGHTISQGNKINETRFK